MLLTLLREPFEYASEGVAPAQVLIRWLWDAVHETLGVAAAGVPRLPDASAAPVDILVATPGRLMAHLKGTPGATLQHLSYLVSPP